MKSIYLKEKNSVAILDLVIEKLNKKLEVKALNGL